MGMKDAERPGKAFGRITLGAAQAEKAVPGASTVGGRSVVGRGARISGGLTGGGIAARGGAGAGGVARRGGAKKGNDVLRRFQAR